MKQRPNFFYLAALLIGVFFAYKIIRLDRSVSICENKLKKYKPINKVSTALIRSQRKFEIADSLEKLPTVDENLILSVKSLPVPGVYAPHNACIVEKDKGFYLFFRYDLLTNMILRQFNSNIGLIELDENLNLTEKGFCRIDTKSTFSEDPRVLKIGSDYHIVYNDLMPNSGARRGIYTGLLDLKNNKVIDPSPQELSLNQFEKNWVPFVKKEDSNLYFEYQITSPRIIIQKTGNRLKKIPTTSNKLESSWSEKWGEIRGGTPAKLVDGQYLAFFHSSFKDKDIHWYVMGAYAFEPEPPFKLTAISKQPLLFRGIYDTIPCNTADPGKNVIFPAGFVEAKQKGRPVIHLSCGENDSGIRILTLDKKALLNSLTPL